MGLSQDLPENIRTSDMNMHGHVDTRLIHYALLYGNEISFEVNRFIKSSLLLLPGLEEIESMLTQSRKRVFYISTKGG